MRNDHDLPCKEFVELVTEYLDGALPAELRAALEAHLEICDDCRLYLGQIRLTVRALHDPAPGPVPPSLKEALLKRFREATG